MKRFLLLGTIICFVFMLSSVAFADTKITEVNFEFDFDKYPLSPVFTHKEWRTMMGEYGGPSSFSEGYGYKYDSPNSGLYYYIGDSLFQTYALDDDPIDPEKEYVMYVHFDPASGYYFDEDDLENLTVKLNGEVATTKIAPSYNDYWGEIDVYICVDTDTSYRPYTIDVYTYGDNVQVGTNAYFMADVVSYGPDMDSVAWSVSGNNSTNTIIDEYGILYVGADETAATLTIRGYSPSNNDVYDECVVNVLQEPLTIDSVTLQSNDEMFKGEWLSLYAYAEGTDYLGIDWDLSYKTSEDTYIEVYENNNDLSQYAALYVGADETVNQITVRAYSVANNSKYDEVTVTLKDLTKITELNVEFDFDEYPFNETYTHKEWNDLYKQNAGPSSYNNTGYILDSNNSSLKKYYGSYYDNISSEDENEHIDLSNKYGISANFMAGRGYYFDPDGYEDIVVKLNGKGAETYTTNSYNSAWEEVKVYIIIPPKQSSLGDVDGNGIIEIVDVRLLLQAFVTHTPSTQWDPKQLAVMDMDGNKDIDIVDVRLLLKAFIDSQKS